MRNLVYIILEKLQQFVFTPISSKNIEDDFEAADGMEGNGVHLNGRNTRRYVIDWIEIIILL